MILNRFKNFFQNLNISEIKKIIDEITLYSAALSFYTIFSLVPIILIILTIFSSSPFFSEFYIKLEHFIASNILPSNQEIIKTYLQNFLSNSSKMGVIGGFYILITSILFFDNYETIIAKIFNKEKRNLWEKIKLYWTMITLFPILFAGVIYLSIKVKLLLNVPIILKLLPFFLLWLIFFLSYKLTLSNENSKNTLLSSLIVTIVFYISKNLFIYYVLINKTYKTIYGSISVLMFLLLWIYISWMIYIAGIYLIKYLDIISQKRRNNGYNKN